MKLFFNIYLVFGVTKYVTLACLLVGVARAQFRDYTEEEIPKPVQGWWGRGDGSSHVDDPSIREFRVEANDTVLNDLNRRLDETIYPEPVEGANFEYGFNSNYLREVVDYWRNKFDWKAQEAVINAIPQYKTQIEGIDVHFLHVKPTNVPEGVSVVQLLLVHGWPGSFTEFLEIIPLLTTPREGTNFVFELVIPSIPGFGFSEAPHQKGFGAIAAGQVFDKLMERLGFQNYYVQGGDWGSNIVNNMAVLYPQKVKGMHVNAVGLCPQCGQIKGVASYFFRPQNPNATAQEKAASLAASNAALEETGYFHIQATKPATVGLAVAQSPAGLAAYILEKMSWATNPQARQAPDGLLTQKISMDKYLTDLMVYWISGSAASSMNIYKERFSDLEQSYNVDTMVIKVPSAVAVFPNEPIMAPEKETRSRMVNLLSYNKMPSGGHFAALEEPQLLADDIWQFVSNVQMMAQPARR